MSENKNLTLLRAMIGKEGIPSPSPFANWLKGIIREVDHNRLSVEFTIRKDMTNPARILHGGVTAGMIDEVMGILVFTLQLETFYPTISLSVDYFGSAKEGDVVLVTAEVVKQGKTVINLKGSVTNAQGKLLAQASSNLVASQIVVKREEPQS